ncbi:MAG: hypothetical protein OIN84_03665, partial [Candidatus Methanoperedens sp.]|nr:hypothetical protein [Candidatus Methanoperedens sp.]
MHSKGIAIGIKVLEVQWIKGLIYHTAEAVETIMQREHPISIGLLLEMQPAWAMDEARHITASSCGKYLPQTRLHIQEI